MTRHRSGIHKHHVRLVNDDIIKLSHKAVFRVGYKIIQHIIKPQGRMSCVDNIRLVKPAFFLISLAAAPYISD